MKTYDFDYRLRLPHSDISLYLARSYRKTGLPVLYVHGSTFPSNLSAGYRFKGYSWKDDLVQEGFDAWLLDLAGYGKSSRFPEMSGPPRSNRPPGRYDNVAEQLSAAVEFICDKTNQNSIAIIAHSWGTIPTCFYSTVRPHRVNSLVLFAPIFLRQLSPLKKFVMNAGIKLGLRLSPESQPAHHLISIQAQWDRFIEDVPAGEKAVLSSDDFAAWGETYLDSDSESRHRSPPAVRIPGGPFADIRAAWTGSLPYDPEKIIAPTLIVRGEWDSLTTDDDAGRLMRSLKNTTVKRDIVIARATHLMHLEENRFGLYRAASAFIHEVERMKTKGAVK